MASRVIDSGYSTASPRGRWWPDRIGLLNDYVRIPYANGSSFASQFLYREFSQRGHEVTVIGPRDPSASADELPRNHICLPSVPLRMHPGLRLPLPSRRSLSQISGKQFDVVLAQTSSAFIDLAAWLRVAHDVPTLCVNTVHLPSVYNVVLTDRMLKSRTVNRLFSEGLMPWLERSIADNYNASDGLVVLSYKFEKYWRDRGVKVPIHVIPRAVEPRIFDVAATKDPFDPRAKKGFRLLNVCRHTREKGVERLLEIFAKWVAPGVPEASLTLVGDGPDHDSFRATAQRLGVADRVFFPGEVSLTDVPTWYRSADLFVYTSLSETYGQVVSEAMWCGLAPVAMADEMGVCQQVQDGKTGVLVNPGPDADLSNWRFGGEVVALLRNVPRRMALAERAELATRERSAPERCVARFYEAFDSARRHSHETSGERAKMRPEKYVLRWAALQMGVASFGMLRPPVMVNRHRSKHVPWDDFPRVGEGVNKSVSAREEQPEARFGA